MSLRKSTSPRRTSRHNPVQPSSQSTAQPWLSAMVQSGNTSVTSFSVEIPFIRVPSPGLPEVSLENDIVINNSGSGIELITSDGIRHSPTSINYESGPGLIDMLFDMSAYAPSVVTMLLHPDQTYIRGVNGSRLAGHVLYVTMIP